MNREEEREEMEPVRIEPGPELDLHAFRPRDLGELLPEWLAICRERGILRVRVIHGKGRGALREGTHALLAKLPGIASIHWPAAADEGGWGATIVCLARRTNEPG